MKLALNGATTMKADLETDIRAASPHSILCALRLNHKRSAKSNATT